MSEYQFAEKDGSIVNEDYDGSNTLTLNEVKESIEKAFALFPFEVEVTPVVGYEDVFCVKYKEDNELGDIYICAKGTTPGGRSNLKDEQRIQVKSKNFNYVNYKMNAGNKAIFLGIYRRDRQIIMCTWKVDPSYASTDATPVSKQIKISSIANAMKEGFAQQCKGRGVYACAFKPEFLYFYLRNNDWLHIGHVSEILEHTKNNHQDDIDIFCSNENTLSDESIIDKGENIIFYGVPGSGKSWTIENEYCYDAYHVERLVFHPDYTNADFIGQILPIVDKDKQVTYAFKAGPFTNILRDAYCNLDKKYVLIIEEINRGNAPAIFGDLFQLLDRMPNDRIIKGIEYKAGTSVYGIINENISKCVFNGNGTEEIRIPANLSIFGTMNTSDQNVFTLDTAFQRRWKMRLIENNFDSVREQLANAEILDTGVTWRVFCETINKQIVGNKSRIATSEDKRLGVYFVHETDLVKDSDNLCDNDNFKEIYEKLLYDERDGKLNDDTRNQLRNYRKALLQIRVFPEKVIKYLWDDAFKFSPETIFDTEKFDCLEDIIHFYIFHKGRERFNIFKQGIKDSLYK